jgi:uncharacterized membrane protein YdjX (TVP38/TMEM64 family)
MPFKLFVLAAAVFEMRFAHFLFAIFAGRFVRFLVLAGLTLQFGPQIVEIAGSGFKQHFGWLLIGAATTALLWFIFRRRRIRARRAADVQPEAS